MIVYVNDGSDFGKGVTELQNGFGHALVMAMKDCQLTTNGVRWSTTGEEDAPIKNKAFENETENWLSKSPNRDNLMMNSFNGIAKTNYMADSLDKYLAAAAIRNYGSGSGEGRRASYVFASDWFMPTISQWIASFKGLGKSTSTFTYPLSGTKTYPGVYAEFENKVGTSGFEMLLNMYDKKDYDNISGKNYNMNFYWSSTQNLAARAICVGFKDDGKNNKVVALAHQIKGRIREAQGAYEAFDGRSVRAFLAF